MKFTIDAHLPIRLKEWLIAQGHECDHTSDLPLGNDTDDNDIIKYIDEEDRIIISKDSDFYNSNLLHGKPRRVLLITTGNISNKNLMKLFQANFSMIKAFFEKGDEVLEINNVSIYVHK